VPDTVKLLAAKVLLTLVALIPAPLLILVLNRFASKVVAATVVSLPKFPLKSHAATCE